MVFVYAMQFVLAPAVELETAALPQDTWGWYQVGTLGVFSAALLALNLCHAGITHLLECTWEVVQSSVDVFPSTLSP